MIKFLSNFITGNDRHWKKEYLTYVDSLQYKACAHRSPLFMHFNLSSVVIVSYVLGYGSHRSTQHLKIIHKDLKSISLEQFQSLHNLNVWMLIATCAILNPQSRDQLFQDGEKYLGIKENEIRIVEEIANLQEHNIPQIAMIVCPEIARILNYSYHGLEFFGPAKLSETLAVVMGSLFGLCDGNQDSF